MHSGIRLLTAMLLLCSAASASAALDPYPWQVDFRYHALFITSEPMATTLSNNGNQKADRKSRSSRMGSMTVHRHRASEQEKFAVYAPTACGGSSMSAVAAWKPAGKRCDRITR